jgi:hypothetical protein
LLSGIPSFLQPAIHPTIVSIRGRGKTGLLAEETRYCTLAHTKLNNWSTQGRERQGSYVGSHEMNRFVNINRKRKAVQ